MSNTCYDPSIDEEIFKLLDVSNKTFNILFRNLSKENLKNKTTLSKHLKFLQDKGIIEWTRNDTGKKGSIKFTQTTKIKRKYNFFTVDYSNKKGLCSNWHKKIEGEKVKEGKKKIILFLVIAAAVYGYTEYKVTSKPRPGDIQIKNNKRKLIDVSISSEEGFSFKDLEKRSKLSFVLDFNRFTKHELEEIFDKLNKNKDIILKRILGSNGKELRYTLEDDMLRELLVWCFSILKIFVSMMKEYWFIVGDKPKHKEIEWFSFIIGEKPTTNLFSKIEYNKTRKKTIENLYIEYRYRPFDLDDSTINKFINELKENNPNIFTKKGMKDFIFKHSNEAILLENYCQIISSEKYQTLKDSKKYEWLFEELLEIINPDFSRQKFKVELTAIKT